MRHKYYEWRSLTAATGKQKKNAKTLSLIVIDKDFIPYGIFEMIDFFRGKSSRSSVCERKLLLNTQNKIFLKLEEKPSRAVYS